MVDNIAAINAYQQVAKLPSAQNQANSGDLFGQLVENSLSAKVNVVKSAEAVGLKALSGEASAEQLTVAITQAEGALRTVTAVRDRVISAYQDIIKMPI